MGWGPAARGTNQVMKRNFQPHPLELLGEKAWGLNPSPVANDVIMPLRNEVSLKTLKNGGHRASGWVSRVRGWEGAVPRDHGSSTPFPQRAPCASLPSGCSALTPSHKKLSTGAANVPRAARLIQLMIKPGPGPSRTELS